MSSLKEIRNRRNSVQSTQKITAAMKMIAAAKLRKSQAQVHASRPYSILMGQMLGQLVEKGRTFEESPKLLVGTGKEHRHIVVLVTADRGLCGSFNANIARRCAEYLRILELENAFFEIVCIGRKGRDLLKSAGFGQQIFQSFANVDKPSFIHAKRVAKSLLERFEHGGFDVCTIFYNRFVSAISQEITSHRLIPYSPITSLEPIEEQEEEDILALASLYEYEPSEKQVLTDLLPKNFAVQIFQALLENAASEHGARMAAMDSATRNAQDMIKGLNLTYNRTRQAVVTRELIEIISGAEAL
ncbi:MAG: F0F1 ATP synthase subunit gamma [Pseudomonadota bacterium]